MDHFQLWSTDATARGTVPLAAFAGYGSSSVYGITAIGGNKALFQVSGQFSPMTGVWASDGTVAGTVQILPVTSGKVYSLGNGKALFQLGTAGLMVTDGTLAGTAGIGSFPGGILGFTATGNGLGLFVASATPGGDNGLWVSDGTATGTTKLLQGPPLGQQGLLRRI